MQNTYIYIYIANKKFFCSWGYKSTKIGVYILINENTKLAVEDSDITFFFPFYKLKENSFLFNFLQG